MTLQRWAATSLSILMTAAALVCAPAAHAQAAKSALKMTFVQPDATVTPTASIPVMLRLTNSSTSQFVINNSLPNFGLLASDLPAQGFYFDTATNTNVLASFATYTLASMGLTYGCNSTFSPTTCTDGPPYRFQFGSTNLFNTPFSLAAGATVDFLFGTYIPSAGPVAAGVYRFYDGGVYLNIAGKDTAGHNLTNFGTLATTCPGQFPPCPSAFFTRTVVAVPEPGGWALMAVGLGAIGWRSRRAIVGRKSLAP